MQTKASQRGFTVIEMVITLAISIGVIMLGTVCLDGYSEKMMLNNTTKEVKSTIEQAATISTIKHVASYIRYYPNSNMLTVTRAGHRKVVKIAPQIKIYKLSDLWISSSGSMSPRTIVITNRQERKTIRLQMMWGRVIDDAA